MTLLQVRFPAPGTPARAALLTFVLAAPLLCLTAFLVTEAVSSQQQQAFESRALEETRSILATLPDDVDGADADELGQALRRPQRLEVVLVDAEGVVSRSSNSVDLADVPAHVRTGRAVPVSARTSVDGESFLVAGGTTGSGSPAVFLFFSERPLQDDQSRLLLASTATAAALAVAATGAGWTRSHRRARHLALRTARERAYTAHLAHELRTPVGALVTAASLIGERQLRRAPEELREPVEMMQDQSRRLRRIVEDLLELSRLESGQIELTPEDVDVAQVVRETIASYGWEDVRVHTTGHTLAHTDRRSIGRLALNLIGNAVRHAERVAVILSGSPDAVVLEVSDDGPGLKAEHVEVLSGPTPFGGRSPARRRHGLGLLIVRAHADLLDAPLKVTTDPGTGTTVRLTFPAADAPDVTKGNRAGLATEGAPWTSPTTSAP
jgi:signal transduction histidine kinase